MISSLILMNHMLFGLAISQAELPLKFMLKDWVDKHKLIENLLHYFINRN